MVPIQLGEGGPLEGVGPETHEQKIHQHTLQNTEYRTQNTEITSLDLIKFLNQQSLLRFKLLKFWNKQRFVSLWYLKNAKIQASFRFILISLSLLDVWSLIFRFAFGARGDSCPHFPTTWSFYSQMSGTIVKDSSLTVSCSSGLLEK